MPHAGAGWWIARGSPGEVSPSTADDPIVRWEAAADGHSPSYATEHDAQKNNGLDH